MFNKINSYFMLLTLILQRRFLDRTSDVLTLKTEDSGLALRILRPYVTFLIINTAIPSI